MNPFSLLIFISNLDVELGSSTARKVFKYVEQCRNFPTLDEGASLLNDVIIEFLHEVLDILRPIQNNPGERQRIVQVAIQHIEKFLDSLQN